MPITPPKFLLWDFDGTLAHRPGLWSETLLTVLRRAGLDGGLEREHVRPYVRAGFPWDEPDRVREPGQPANEWWTALAPMLERAFKQVAGVDDRQAAALAAQVRETYLDPEAWVVFEDTIPALRRLSELGWRHIVLSNHVPELPMVIERLGLTAYFEEIHTSAATGVEKPNGLAFRRVLAALPTDSQVWMIGDNPVADVAGAEAVGIPAILVRNDSPQATRRSADLSGVDAFLGVSPP